jgi:hypothetical protein
MLIASALLSLSVMSAFVAFNGFPGQGVQAPIGSLLLGEQHPPTVTVPTKPVRPHGSAAGRSSANAGEQRSSGHARAVKSPVAHANPVVNSAPSGQAPTQTQAPSSPAPQQSTSQVTPGTVSDPLPATTTPSLPTTAVPLPQVSLPPPPDTSQLPVDTSGVTGVLGQ